MESQGHEEQYSESATDAQPTRFGYPRTLRHQYNLILREYSTPKGWCIIQYTPRVGKFGVTRAGVERSGTQA